MDKAPDAYRTISEVGEDLDIAQHVLRFWETRFPQIKPLKRGGGRRYYRPDDVELLKGIRYLLYKEGYTIKGVQRILKEQGPRAVQAFAQPQKPETWQEPETFEAPETFNEPAHIGGDSSMDSRSEVRQPPALATRTPPGSEPASPRGHLREAGPLFAGSEAASPQPRIEPSPAYPEPKHGAPTRLATPSVPGQVSMFRGGVQSTPPLSAVGQKPEYLADLPSGEEPAQRAASIDFGAEASFGAGTKEGLVFALQELEACKHIISTALSRRAG